MLTAYDYSTASMLDEAGIDGILVGDSLGNVMLGYEDTVSVTMEDMIHHSAAVARGAKNCLLVTDMPFMSYQVSVPEAVMNAGRLIKEGRANAVKLEGGASVAPQIRAITDAGIPVMAHLGLTPQSINTFGGYKVQGKTREAAQKLLDDALAVQEAGAFSLVLECVPSALAGRTDHGEAMICAIDIGNSHIVTCLMESADSIIFTGRVRSDRDKTAEEYFVEMKTLSAAYGVSFDHLDGVIISSVVPALTDIVRAGIRQLTGLSPMTVGHGLKTGIRIAMDQPCSVGSDLIADAAGACQLGDGPFIIFDLGTATTCSVVDESHTYLGTLIIPGVRISQEALTSHAAQLPAIRYEKPRHLIGKNTAECMQAGLVYGTAAMMDGLIDRIEEELGERALVLATGGIASVIVPHCRRKLICDDHLLMRGLWYLFEKNRKTNRQK